MAKISPCFSDILFPTEVCTLFQLANLDNDTCQYYYDQSWWSGTFEYPDNVPWENKQSSICTCRII
jgi:hypothetical protein